jgi:serine protease Do
MVAAIRPGTKVPVELWRKGASKQVTVVVAEMPEEGSKSVRPAPKPANEAGEIISRLGITASELNSEQLQELQVSGGLLVEDVKSSAARAAGLHQGDVLLAVNNEQIRSLAQFSEILKQVPKGRNVALLVRRGDNASYVAIKLDEK